MQLRVRNHRHTDLTLEMSLSLPAGWRSTPERVNLRVPVGGEASTSISLVVPLNWNGSNERRAIAADVTANGIHLGQIAEAVVDVRSRS